MYKFLLHFHSGWAYLTILMAVLFFVMVGFYAINKKERSQMISRLSLVTTVVFHLQFLAGILLYFVSPYSKWGENTMSDSTLRFYSLEHPMIMIAAVVFITIANSKLKKTDLVKMSTAIYALLALLCVLSRIPWAQWP